MTDQYPLVWWLKKSLPHRHGQRCKRADYSQVYDDRAERRKWMGKDVECFEFDDGQLEWGPKRGARRPNREWSDVLEHKTGECVGVWHHARDGYVCSECGQWVRRNDQTRPVFQASQRMDWSIHNNVKAAGWSTFLSLLAEGLPAQEVAEHLLELCPSLTWDRPFNLALRDAKVMVNTKYGRSGMGGYW